MTAIDHHTFELFRRAALSDDDPGYPYGTAFIPLDVANVDDVVWRNLNNDRRPVVLVSPGGTEVLVKPLDRGPLARCYESLRGRIGVQVAWRHHGLPDEYSVRTSVGHHPVADLRQPVSA